MDALTGINLYGWTLLATVAAGIVTVIVSTTANTNRARLGRLALVPALAGALVLITVLLHSTAVASVLGLVTTRPVTIAVAVLTVLLAIILVDFTRRRVIPIADRVVAKLRIADSSRRDMATGLVALAAVAAIVAGLASVGTAAGGYPASGTPIANDGRATVPSIAISPTPFWPPSVPTAVPGTQAPDPTKTAPAVTTLTLSLVASELDEPLYVTHAGDDRLFVVERPGRILVLERNQPEWRVTSTFLDIKSLVDSDFGEQGLLGLAFHPEYASNGLFYVTYTNENWDLVLAEYHRASWGGANVASRRELLSIRHFDQGHNAGWLGFHGALLYVAVGDGQGEIDYDIYNVAQATDELLGKILRIDPIDPDGSGPKQYSIPPSNPLVGQDGLGEIFAWGLRNPWRNSFDRATGQFWIADVGAGSYEEINRVSAEDGGYNFGWPHLEGRHLRSSAEYCTSDCQTQPVIEYAHDGGSCGVIGGYVSRRPGAAMEGNYVYGDICSGLIWQIPDSYRSGDPVAAPLDTGFSYWSLFGEDNLGRIYIANLSGGQVWIIDQS